VFGNTFENWRVTEAFGGTPGVRNSVTPEFNGQEQQIAQRHGPIAVQIALLGSRADAQAKTAGKSRHVRPVDRPVAIEITRRNEWRFGRDGRGTGGYSIFADADRPLPWTGPPR